ncbi:MAG: DUF697 domain-containing protein [Planctomycetota bacterium]|jgi:uncharacterized membrane protein YcjF (UPF0283 family)
MATPITDLVHVLKRLFRFVRYAGIATLVIVLLLAVREVADVYRAAHGIHPALGWAFLLVAAIVVIRFLGVPLLRFLAVPVALRPPLVPEDPGEWKPAHVAARRDFLARFLAGLARNPALEAKREEIRAAERELAGVADAAGIVRFEKERVDPLLAPLDREADRLIRAEALSVGVATALSPSGALDAFLVLWRNANLVSRLANLYYGKPGVRGSLLILSDVSSAALLATYMEGISGAVGGVLRGIFGSVVGVVAGPVVDGSVNALATLRIGYVARARCRSYRAWTEVSRRAALKAALGAAKDRSKEVLAEIVRAAGGTVSDLTGKVGETVKEGFSALLRKLAGKEEAGPAPENA